MLKKKTIVAGERVSYRRGAEKRKKASVPHPKQYGTVEKLDDKTKSLLHIIFDSGERRQLLKSKVTHEDQRLGDSGKGVSIIRSSTVLPACREHHPIVDSTPGLPADYISFLSSLLILSFE